MADRGQNADRAFDRLDANKDGQVSRQEFDAGRVAREQREALRQPGEHVGGNVYLHRKGGMGFAGRMFEMADANHDGRVSLQEMTDAALRHFDMADANHDGRLTLQEAEAAALEHFDKADLNHDGKITPDERAQIHALRHERKPS